LIGYYRENHNFLEKEVVSALASNLKKLKILGLYCPIDDENTYDDLIYIKNLKELLIDGATVEKSMLVKWSEWSFPHLESLELPVYTENDKIDDGLIPLIKKLPHLRCLDLHGSGITDCCLEAIASSCPLLRELDLSLCKKITRNGVQTIIDSCTLLKRLNI